MWIKKQDRIELERKVASLESQLELRKGQIARQEKEIDYWRGKFEEAQNRADRAQDRALQAREMGPVSDLGVKELGEQAKKYAEMMKEAVRQSEEMFADEIPGQGEAEELEVAPELLAALENSLKE